MEDEMFVIKRDGSTEVVYFDKILARVRKLGAEATPPLSINYSQLVMKVIDQLYPNIRTTEIDELTAQQCASMATKNVDYAVLANRIIVSNHQKNTSGDMLDVVTALYNHVNVHGQLAPLVHPCLYFIMSAYRVEINQMLDYSRDYLIDYFGFKTLERAYLMKVGKAVVERPQHMWMRVAIGIHMQSSSASDACNGNCLLNRDLLLSQVKETYDLLSQLYYTHATPTLFHAGTPRPQLSSCYLLGMEDDSIDGIYNTLKDCAQISKWAGGIGLHVHNIRAKGSRIVGTNGTSNGLVPMLRVFNMTARYVDQGGNKRNGSFAIYLEPWHADIEDFLDLRKNHGDEEMRARDLFYAMWIPDLFMEKVKEDGDWALFCPHACPGLSDVYGDEFRTLYEYYVANNQMTRTVKARELWFKMLDSQMETGTPYFLYKDAVNLKNNQMNLGTIKSSNLCTEIMEFSTSTSTSMISTGQRKESAVCNLASIGLRKFVKETEKTFDYDLLHKVTRVIVRNLNKVIEINYYPTAATEASNFKHRPIGVGVQGLADVFAMMDLSFGSPASREVNKLIFETIYHAALTESVDLVAKDGLTYSSFIGSPASKGQLQFDLWKVQPPSNRYDWPALRERIKDVGLKNSLLIALMPTASTSQILGNNECFEPFTSNIYSRRTNAGEFVMVNKYLMEDLNALGMWSDAIKDNIILNKGSVQQLTGLSEHLKEKYRTVWEIPMRTVIDMSVDRAPFVCQSQSMNLWVENPNYKILTSMHFHAWESGLKTGIYYLRRKARHQPQQFTIAPTTMAAVAEECEMCSS